MAPNIVVIMSDQHRADMMGCAGDPVVRTPHLDRLAAEGVRFTRANCQGPLCMPARTSFLTERYVRDHGVFDNAAEVDDDVPTFLHALREAGYHTAEIGKMHLWVHGRSKGVARMRPKLEAFGFDEPIETVGKLAAAHIECEYTDYLRAGGLYDSYCAHIRARNYGKGKDNLPMWDATPIPLAPADYIDAWHGRRVADWIDAYDRDRPFFLWVGFPGPHDPWDAPAEALAAYAQAEIPLPCSLEPPDAALGSDRFRRFVKHFLDFSDSASLTDERIRAVRRAYYANITMIDEAIGGIRAALERRGLLDDTWVLYTGDHGELMGEHRMLAKMLFYDAAVRVPLIVRPPGGTAPAEVDAIVEQLDVPATCRTIAQGPEPEGSAGRSLLGYLTGARRVENPRTVSVSENYGFAAFETDAHKLVVDEDTLEPCQLFERATDPTEDANLVADPAQRDTIEALMAEHVRPFFARAPMRRSPLSFAGE